METALEMYCFDDSYSHTRARKVAQAYSTKIRFNVTRITPQYKTLYFGSESVPHSDEH